MTRVCGFLLEKRPRVPVFVPVASKKCHERVARPKLDRLWETVAAWSNPGRFQAGVGREGQ
jgi:hypothetical protein